MTKTMEDLIREQARLIILKALAQQVDERLNSDLILPELERFGIRKPREWLHGEMDWLHEMGAVSVQQVGSLRVATLSDKGARHLDRSVNIEGVQRPSRG